MGTCAYHKPEIDYHKAQRMHYRTNRNPEWMKKLNRDSLRDMRPCLLVPGVYHLYGSDGLIALLRNEGWVVEPYSLQWPQTKSDFPERTGPMISNPALLD